MAADLAAGPSSGIEVVCCGDAHVSNFGIYAAPHRALVFDLNDFDEAAVAPWEWDVKRLITSAIVGGRQNGYTPKTIRAFVDRAVTARQHALRQILGLNVLDRYYLRFEPARYRDQAGESLQPGDRPIRTAGPGTNLGPGVRAHHDRRTGGGLRLREDPPVLLVAGPGARTERECRDPATATSAGVPSCAAPIVEWSYAHADKSLDDFHQLQAAAKAG